MSRSESRVTRRLWCMRHSPLAYDPATAARYPRPAMRLLLVEDDRMIGESLQRTLRLEGYAVDWVRDTSAADGTLASERFDLVLLDLGLPRGAAAGPADGLALLQVLRARRDAGDRAHRPRRARRPRRRPRRRRRRLPRQAVRVRRAQRTHPRRAAPPRRTRRAGALTWRRDARSGAAPGESRRRAGVALGARVRG